jgi:hypothetical protein
MFHQISRGHAGRFVVDDGLQVRIDPNNGGRSSNSIWKLSERFPGQTAVTYLAVKGDQTCLLLERFLKKILSLTATF